MPPPKKPKSGPTSIEQFMSTEEIRTPSDDEDMRERTGSCSSDVSVICEKTESDKESQIFEDEKSPSGLKLLRDLITKKVNDEQRVPGSCSSGRSSCQSLSPSNESEDASRENSRASTTASLTSEERKKHPPSASSPISPMAGSVLPPFGNSANPQTAATTVRGSERLINSMVASSFMSGAFPTSPTTTSYSAYFPSYLYGQSLQSSYYLNNFDSEPRDLSTKIQKENQNRERLFDRSSVDSQVHRDIEQRLSAHFGLGSYDSLTDRKDLDSRKNLVGILTEPRYNHLRFPVSPVDRDAATFPFFVNGYESRRESIEKLVPKEEHGSHHSPSMVPQGSFLSMPYMMHNQVPSSTTLEFRDHDGRILPLLDPSLSFADGRKLKHSAVTGHGPNKLCQVCSDNASGFHYGVWSCEGCKAFFKRSIQGPVDYVCPATNTCTIDKHRRKSCQACRLRKCYEVGMNKGSQRKERKGSISMSKPTATKRSRADSSDNTVNSTSGSPNPAKSARKSQTVTILQALNKAALPVLESHHNHGQPPTKVHLLNSLVKLAERELVHLINWAKNVPGYTDLSLSDQVHLIECCWMELLLLNCAFRSIEHGGKSLAFAPDLVLDRSSWSTIEMAEIFEQVAAVSEQMMQNHLHKDELLLLQAMVLVNAEVRRLASCNQIYNMQQALLDAIVDTAQKYHPDNVRHVPAVLLLLTHIRQAGERGIAYFQRLKSEGIVTFCDLLKEMLDAQDFLEKKSSNEGD